MHRKSGVNTYKEVTEMTEYREILRLSSQGISQRGIARSCACSRNTVQRVIQQAKEKGITWEFAQGMTDRQLHQQLAEETAIPKQRRMPEYEYVHKEMSKSGVTLSLLWHEYCEAYRSSNEIPLMYTQFCYHYREYSRPKQPCTSSTSPVNRWK